LSSRKKNDGIEKNLSDAICFLVTEKSQDLLSLRELDVAAFMVLLDYIMEQQEKEKKEYSKMKNKKR
jgi:hypothetical protein